MAPSIEQPDIICSSLHVGHFGTEKTKLLAKSTVFWININKEIDQLISSCPVCQEHQPSQTAKPLLKHDIPTKPWSVVGTDLVTFDGNQWFIVADYNSKFPIIRKLPDPSPSSVIVAAIKQIFGEHRIPEKVISDNGPYFNSTQFQNCAKSGTFDHITPSPRYQKANCFIERQFKTIKLTLKKAKQSNTDYEIALLLW